MGELNKSYESIFNHSFADSIIKHCGKSDNIARKETACEKKQKKRKLQRNVCSSISKKFASNAAINFLSENESFAAYQRKRMAQSFENSPEASCPKKRRVTDTLIDKYKEIVVEKFFEWPQDKKMNWRELGRMCGVESKNVGQVVREIAQEIGIASNVPNSISHTRSSKAKLPGNEISVPAMPTVASIKDGINEYLDCGTLTLGEPCSPFTLTKVSVVEGKLESISAQIYGRKVSLLELRKRILKRQEKFMRLMSDVEINALTLEEVQSKLKSFGEVVQADNAYNQLKILQRSRTLVLWHDHSTILASGYLLMTIHCLYDPAVYLSTEEYEDLTNTKCARSVQEVVEEPELYIICLSSSSLSDQLATISDRLDCLPDMVQPVFSSNNIPIKDSLRFFIGDHPAQSFERGNQVGGNYKCGSCGCKSDRIDDLAHVYSCSWRSLGDLQQLVLKGKFGSQPGVLKPFANLKKDQLLEELRQRNVFDLSGNKPELLSNLQSILCGTQRVPTILITNPSGSLSDINLETYTVLDCEPLHDLKGHLINLLPEIPHVLSGDSKVLVSDILQHLLFSKKQNGYSGSDLRIALIQVSKVVQSLDVNDDIKLLLLTAVKISERLYSSYEKRTPKTILQLHNCTWLHHELCKSVISKPKEITYGKLFGLYLHSLVVHAPRQYEIMCLRSVNTENQERMFQQAKQIALNCTNRKPENVIPSILLRIQAKIHTGKLSNIYNSAKTRVENVASEHSCFNGTKISSEFISAHSHSWQAHLERISRFLVHKKVWWEKTNDECFLFYDGDNDPDFRPDGPCLYHFRSYSLKDIEGECKSKWKYIMENKVELPCDSLRIFDESGNFVSLYHMHNSIDVGNNSCGLSHNPSLNQEVDISVSQNPSLNQEVDISVSQNPSLNQEVDISVSQNPLLNQEVGISVSQNLSLNQEVDISVSQNPSLNQQIGIHFSPVVTSTPITQNSSFADKSQSTCTPKRISTKCRPTRMVSLSQNNDVSDQHEQNCLIVPAEPEVHLVEQNHYQSKHAKVIAVVIGQSNELALYDKIHVKLKSNQHVNHHEHANYKDILSGLQVQVLKKKMDIVGQIKKIEKDFYANHQQLPPPDHQGYSELCSKLKNAKALLRSWKIKL